MSIYSIVSLAALLAIVAAGTTVKLVLSARRRRLDGFHGFVSKKEAQESGTDDWELP